MNGPGRETAEVTTMSAMTDPNAIPEREVLPLAELRDRFASEWVLLDQLQFADETEILGGRVHFHSPDRRELTRKAIALQPQHGAILYTGEFRGGYMPGSVAVTCP
jgi:hypothetical protein